MNSANIQWKGRRVLVADDEEPVRSLVAAIVERSFGCRVDTASSGDEALDMLAGEVIFGRMTRDFVTGATNLR